MIRDYKKLTDHVVDWLKDYATKANATGFVIGISGGIDSSVVSTLCAMTGLKLTVLEMPIHQREEQSKNATLHKEWLKKRFENVDSVSIDLTATFDQFVNSLTIKPTELTGANTRSRLRMVTLYSYAGNLNRLVAGTGNRVEDFGIGFFTKGGDGMIDLSPIADLTKTEVWTLGEYLEICPEIISAAPTDGLWDGGHTDEDQIGADYPELEWAMEFIDSVKEDNSVYDLLTKRQKEVLAIYSKRHAQNKHKMDPIPVCSVAKLRTEKAVLN